MPNLTMVQLASVKKDSGMVSMPLLLRRAATRLLMALVQASYCVQPATDAWVQVFTSSCLPLLLVSLMWVAPWFGTPLLKRIMLWGTREGLCPWPICCLP